MSGLEKTTVGVLSPNYCARHFLLSRAWKLGQGHHLESWLSNRKTRVNTMTLFLLLPDSVECNNLLRVWPRKVGQGHPHTLKWMHGPTGGQHEPWKYNASCCLWQRQTVVQFTNLKEKYTAFAVPPLCSHLQQFKCSQEFASLILAPVNVIPLQLRWEVGAFILLMAHLDDRLGQSSANKLRLSLTTECNWGDISEHFSQWCTACWKLFQKIACHCFDPWDSMITIHSLKYFQFTTVTAELVLLIGET